MTKQSEDLARRFADMFLEAIQEHEDLAKTLADPDIARRVQQAIQEHAEPTSHGSSTNGLTVEERVADYSADLARKLAQTYPTQALANMVRSGELGLGDTADDVAAFLDRAAEAGFSLWRTPLDAFLRDHVDELFEGVSEEQTNTVIAHVKAIQRVYRITAGSEAADELLSAGLYSAYDLESNEAPATITTKQREELADAFQAICPTIDRLIMPNGYRDSAFALIDAVFSMQARYEGARRVVANYAAWTGLRESPGLPKNVSTPDQHRVEDLLTRLDSMPAEQAAKEVFRNRARSPRANRLKAELVVDAARALVAVGLCARGDVATLPTDADYARQKHAWSGVRGLGPVTFEYFRMLCGAESSKPDIMILGWLEENLGVRYSWQRALELIGALTDELTVRWETAVPMRGVDHTIWRHQSGRGLDPNAAVGWKATFNG